MAVKAEIYTEAKCGYSGCPRTVRGCAKAEADANALAQGWGRRGPDEMRCPIHLYRRARKCSR